MQLTLEQKYYIPKKHDHNLLVTQFEANSDGGIKHLHQNYCLH